MAEFSKLWRGVPQFASLFKQVAQRREFCFSFNIADRRPVGCLCYWRATPRVTELGDDAAVEFFQARRAEGKLLATIVGGEPYVRPDLLRRVTPIMPENWVVTSATTPLLALPNTTHFVSIDCRDAETHDAVRRSPGLYDRIIRNMSKARAQGPFPVFVHSVLNALNYKQGADILRAGAGIASSASRNS